MKKLLLTGLLSASLTVAGASTLLANGTTPAEAAPEGLEISGNVDVVVGYQHDDKDAILGNAKGGMGDFLTNIPNGDHFRFVVDQVEIDLAKSFGENIRLRADVDFTDFGNTNSRAIADVIDLEQGYVTLNLAAGNGIEFLVGKFNAPVGIESVDRNDNWLISYSDIYRFLTPTNVTGAKLYYAFNDHWDFDWAVVNSLNSTGFAADSALPSTLFRLGYSWGDEGKKSLVNLCGAAGPEQGGNAHWDFYGDLDVLVALSDTVNFGAQGTYRQTNDLTSTLQNQKVIAGQLLLNYEASDVWDVTFRYGWMWDLNSAALSGGASTTGGNWGGFEGTTHSGTVGFGYQIADGAKMKMEYRFDFAAVSGPAFNSDYHSLMAEFAYTF